MLSEIHSRFVQPSESVKRKLAALDNQSTEALIEANQSLRAKQYAYKKQLDDLPYEHRLKKHYIRYKELFPSVWGVISPEHCNDVALTEIATSIALHVAEQKQTAPACAYSETVEMC